MKKGRQNCSCRPYSFNRQAQIHGGKRFLDRFPDSSPKELKHLLPSSKPEIIIAVYTRRLSFYRGKTPLFAYT